jgi:hypothetical protein
MDCEHVKELLDAYALGAAEPEEAAALEEHMADCVRCWAALNEAQRAAASLALSTTPQPAPDSLRRRILADAERLQYPAGPKLLERLPKLWPTGVGLLAATAAASLAFTLFVQTEVSDLRGENDRLAADVETADAQLMQQQQVMALLAAPDTQQIKLEPTDPTSSASAVYHWSGSAKMGAILCHSLPPLQEGQVYQIWFLTEDDSYPAGRFETWHGIGQTSMYLGDIPEHPVAIGVSIEQDEDAEEPGEMLLLAELQQ